MIVTLPNNGLSRSAEMRSKSWMKRLTGVDAEAGNGYAFLGEFEPFEATVNVPEGTYFLSYVEDVSGSGRMRGRDLTLYRVEAEGLKKVDVYTAPAGKGWAFHVTGDIKAAMEPAVSATVISKRGAAARVDCPSRENAAGQLYILLERHGWEGGEEQTIKDLVDGKTIEHKGFVYAVGDA